MPKTNTGGKRQGAGFPHETKAQTAALMGQQKQQMDELAVAPTPHDVDLSLYNLDHKQKTVAIAMGRGMMGSNRITRTFHIARPTLKTWLENSEFQRLITDIHNKLANEPMFALHPLVPKAVQTYEDVLDQRDDLSLAARVAQDVLDRQWGKPIVRSLSAGLADIHIHFSEEPVDIKQYIEVDDG